jgi:uncharacterized membrane protein YkvI
MGVPRCVLRHSWVLAAAVIGTVIGAGFCTGQELAAFFLVHGTKGLLGVLLAALLFMVLTILIVRMAIQQKAISHRTILRNLFGPVLGSIFDWAISFFLIGVLSIMLAATGALVNQHWGIPSIVGIIAMAIFTIIIVGRNANTLLSINGGLVIFLVLLILTVLISVTVSKPLPGYIEPLEMKKGLIPNSWILSAILYVSYNMGIVFSVLAALGDEFRNKRVLFPGSVLVFFGLGLTGFFILLAMLDGLPDSAVLEVPILSIINRYPSVSLIYIMGMITAILTTCVGTAYGLGSRLNEEISIGTNKWSMLLVLIAIPLALFGFGSLVQVIYPLLGYLTLFIMALICVKSIFK